MLNTSLRMTGRSRSLICGRTAAIVCAFSVSASLLAGCGGKKDAATETGSSSTPGAAAPSGPEIQIAVIPKGTTHDYWKSLHAGAAKAEQEAKAAGKNVHIIWKGPVREDDRNAQVDVVNTFTTQKVSAMVLAPLDSEALARPVEAAADAGIPVVIIDSSLNSKKIASYVATDNEKGGTLAGQQMIKLLGGKGRILVLRYGIGSASTEAREKGFLDTIKTAPGITVVSSDQYAGPTVDTAYRSAQNVLGRYGKQIEGVFTPNESSTLGMRLALKDINELGKLKFVGFDSSKPLIEKQISARALAQIEVLTQQISALRRQLAALEEALDASEKRDKESQGRIADLGQRLNVALAQRVQELSRYRSEFFGRLRAILGNRPDIRIVGDRFVFQSEVFFDTGQALLLPEGRAELDKLASALIDLDKQIPSEIAWVLRVDGHTDVRPINSPVFKSNWELSSARAISVVQYLISLGVPRAAAGRGRLSPNSSRSTPRPPKTPTSATAASS